MRSPDVAEPVDDPELAPGTAAVFEIRHVLAGVVGPRLGRIAPVIGREDQRVARPDAVQQLRQPGVQARERVAVAAHVAAVSVFRIEVVQVDEHQTMIR